MLRALDPRFLTFLLLVATACGCGSSSGVTSGGGTAVQLSFMAASGAPGSASVALGSPITAGAAMTLSVEVRGTNEVYGGTFDLYFDPTVVRFDAGLPGDLLERSGTVPRYDVIAIQPGHLLVIASLSGAVSGVDVTTAATLVRLRFVGIAAGTTTLEFQGAQLLDDQDTPEEIAGLSWHGGTLVAR